MTKAKKEKSAKTAEVELKHAEIIAKANRDAVARRRRIEERVELQRSKLQVADFDYDIE